PLSGFSLPITPSQAPMVSRLTGHVLHRLKRQPSADSPFRDQVFARFLARRTAGRLELEVNRALRRMLIAPARAVREVRVGAALRRATDRVLKWLLSSNDPDEAEETPGPVTLLDRVATAVPVPTLGLYLLGAE